MPDARSILLERQRDAFRVGIHATGLTFKQLAHRFDASERALRTWAAGEAEMPLHALGAFAACFPAAVQLLLDDGLALVRAPDGADHADFAAGCMAFAASYVAARAEASEAGAAIGPGEGKVLEMLRASVAGQGK